jgi:hypothetical protein
MSSLARWKREQSSGGCDGEAAMCQQDSATIRNTQVTS